MGGLFQGGEVNKEYEESQRKSREEGLRFEIIQVLEELDAYYEKYNPMFLFTVRPTLEAMKRQQQQ